MDLDNLRDWIGRTEQRTDDITAMPVAALSATLDRDDAAPVPGSDLPHLWHWMYFAPLAQQREIGPDGHPNRGGFLPPVPLPRRMWAGSRLSFHHPLQVGDEVTRSARIADVSVKTGRSGTLVFVTVRHEIHNARGLAISEEQDIVYRDAPTPGAPAPAPQAAATGEAVSRTITPDPVLLFRYSALTFNGHRIHYDRPYATQVEGYPGLIVHGPLMATLLAQLACRQHPGRTLRRFDFRALKPVFDTAPFSVNGRPDGNGNGDGDGRAALWVRDPVGDLAMQASAQFE
ncbi:MAG: acyl-CoA dehydrogenase [Burkholderiales bacterium PBB5]|nr:MAG: acyl-CoA dehydrogenase [Burkholderiales bacterium PBB5]